MGKYMKKAKTPWELTVMELTHQASMSGGVRTRAKTLALQRLQKTAAAAAVTGGGAGAAVNSSSVSYLQLRNRRLEKPPVHDSKRKNLSRKKYRVLRNPNPNLEVNSKFRSGSSVKTDSVSGEDEKSVKGEDVGEKAAEAEAQEKEMNNTLDSSAIEASFGENVLDFEGRGRGTRESTPCSLIMDTNAIRTPGSTTRPTSSPELNRRIQNSVSRNIPTAHEMNDFFAAAEQHDQRQFIEKYNFDPVNEKPLPGRYEWVKLDP